VKILRLPSEVSSMSDNKAVGLRFRPRIAVSNLREAKLGPDEDDGDLGGGAGTCFRQEKRALTPPDPK
jgi:hypothetical protein